eukprot:861324-Amphidinium_carterae.1
MISEDGKKVVLARLSRRCGRHAVLPSFGGRCLCQLSGDPISFAMTTRTRAEPSLLPAPVQRAQLLHASMSCRLRSYGSFYVGRGQQLAFVSRH